MIFICKHSRIVKFILNSHIALYKAIVNSFKLELINESAGSREGI